MPKSPILAPILEPSRKNPWFPKQPKTYHFTAFYTHQKSPKHPQNLPHPPQSIPLSSTINPVFCGIASDFGVFFFKSHTFSHTSTHVQHKGNQGTERTQVGVGPPPSTVRAYITFERKRENYFLFFEIKRNLIYGEIMQRGGRLIMRRRSPIVFFGFGSCEFFDCGLKLR